jgi:hypothetical protein
MAWYRRVSGAECCRTSVLGQSLDCRWNWSDRAGGAVAQLGEHLLCKQGVSGSIPLSSTKSMVLRLTVLTGTDALALNIVF